MKAVKFLKPYGYDSNEVSKASGLSCPEGSSLAVQSSREESDINVIVERYTKTGMLPQRQLPPLEMDFENVFDFQTAQNMIRQAEEAFAALPADVRYRFHNDPNKFVTFCSDDGNLDEMVKMGLAVKKPEVSDERGSDSDVGGASGQAGARPGGDEAAAGAGKGAKRGARQAAAEEP